MRDFRLLKRPHFFDGKLLTAADLEAEQDYHIDMLKRPNQSLHGFGVISGLKVTIESRQVVVEPGIALDCEGHEIVVGASQLRDFASLVNLQTAYVSVRYVERLVDPVPVGTGGEEHANVVEGFELTLVRDNCNRGHRHARGRWIPCGRPHDLTIAKLRATPRGWRVDRRYRPPAAK